MRYREQSYRIESDNQEEVGNIFQEELKEKESNGWTLMIYMRYISSRKHVPYGIEYTISKWE